MKLFVFTTEPNQYFSKEIVKSAAKLNVDVEIVDFNEVILYDNAEQSALYVNDTKLEINADSFIIARFSFENSYFKTAVLEFCVSCGAKLINTPGSLTTCNDKLRSQLKLTQLGVKTPWAISIINNNSEFLANLEKIQSSITGPAILKTNNGTHGIGVMKVESIHSLVSVVQAFINEHVPVLIQEYIEHKASYRIIMLGDSVLASNKRFSSDFRTNSHLGSSTEKHEPTENEIDICKKIVQGFKCNFCAIDYLLINDEVIVLEVNGSPGLEYIQENYPDKNLTDNIVNYAKSTFTQVTNKEICVNCIVGSKSYEAKVDTGATLSSIDASNISSDGDVVNFDFDGDGYTLPLVRIITVKNANSKQQRPVVEFEFNIDGMHIKTPVSLADRSGLKYKILIGYKTLQDFGIQLKLNNTSNE